MSPEEQLVAELKDAAEEQAAALRGGDDVAEVPAGALAEVELEVRE